MNRSAGLVALVPPGVVTVTSTVPLPVVGAMAVMRVSLLTVNVAAVVAEVHRGGGGEGGASDSDLGPVRPRGWAHATYAGWRLYGVGVLVGRAGGARASRRGDGHVHRANRPGWGGGGDSGRVGDGKNGGWLPKSTALAPNSRSQ